MRLTENIIQQLRDYLGGDFRLFDSNSGGDIELASKDRNVVVGVCYNTYGDYVAVREATAIESGMIIDFAIPIGATFDGYVEKIEAMSQDFNAQYNQVVYDNDGIQTAVVNYVLLFEVQKPTSNIIASLNNFRQTISVTIKITASPDMAFGNAAKVEIYNGGVWRQLENVIDATWTNTNENMPRVDLDSYQSTNESQYSTQKLVVTYFYKNSSVLHSLFEGHNVGGVNSQYTLRYTQNGETTTFLANTVNYSHQNPVGGFQPVVVEFVKAVTQEAVQNYTLTLSPSANSTITVTRYGIELSTGATIYSGDILTITAEVSTGYTLTSLKANNVSVVSGGNYTVTGNTTITTTVEHGSVATYILTIDEAEGSILTVSNGGTALATGSIIQSGDELVITAAGKTGYDVTNLTVNGVAFTSGDSITVSDNIIAATVADLKTFTLTESLTIPSGVPSDEARVRVYKTADYYGTTYNTVILDTYSDEVTASVKYGDVLKYVYDIKTAKYLKNTAFTLNGTTISNNGKAIVTSDVMNTSTFAKIAYALVYSGNGADILAFRGMTPTEPLASGDIIYYNDTIHISASPTDTGYSIRNIDVNGTLYARDTVTFNCTGTMMVVVTVASYVYYYTPQVTGAWNYQIVNYGSSTTILAAPTYSGYTFNYWLERGTSNKYYGGESYRGKSITLDGQYTYEKPTLQIILSAHEEAGNGYSIMAQAVLNGELTPVASELTIVVNSTTKGNQTLILRSGMSTALGTTYQSSAAAWGVLSGISISPQSDSTYNYLFAE